MKTYQLYTSTYKNVEQMKAHHISDMALELERSGGPFYISAESPEEAARQFHGSKEFCAFASQHIGKTVYVYYINNAGEPVKIGQ